MTKNLNRAGAVFCAAAVMIWLLAGILMHVNTASAAEHNGSLTLWCVKDDDVVADMHWQIYRVGYRNDDDYVFEGDFAGYRATLGDRTKPMLEWDTDTVAAAGETLKIQTIVEEIPCDDDGTTDAEGAVTFSGLEPGLYLVWGDILKKEETTYIPSAIFFEVTGEEANVLNAYPKIVLRTLNEEEVQYSVKKVWLNDEDQPWNRGVSITVARYRDNEYYDEVVLSDANGWTEEWGDTDDHTWFVYEKIIPAGYTVSYKEHHTQYLIVNTFEGITDDSSHTDIQTTASAQTTDDDSTETSAVITTAESQGSSQTTAVITTAESQSNSQATTVNTTEKSHTTAGSTTYTDTRTTTTATGDAPQTGQLWWPVLPLGGGGLLMLWLGLKITKKENDG